jgi:hypothetical protein
MPHHARRQTRAGGLSCPPTWPHSPKLRKGEDRKRSARYQRRAQAVKSLRHAPSRHSWRHGRATWQKPPCRVYARHARRPAAVRGRERLAAFGAIANWPTVAAKWPLPREARPVGSQNGSDAAMSAPARVSMVVQIAALDDLETGDANVPGRARYLARRPAPPVEAVRGTPRFWVDLTAEPRPDRADETSAFLSAPPDCAS